MSGAVLNSLTREELEAENARLRAALEDAGIDAQHVTKQQATRDARHSDELATSRAETAQANQNTRNAHAGAAQAAREHGRQMSRAASDLASSQDLVAELQASRAALASSEARQRAIHSMEGEGTTVTIYLPRHRGEAEQDEARADGELAPVAKAGETVLVVDDEPTVRMLVTDVLSDLGYTAVEAADGAGGLKVLQSDARVDLLITDVGLPGGLNGRQMADAARVTRADLKVLFITGYAENALLSNGQLDPGMAVLTKPFAVDTLAARIRELITQSAP